MFLHENGWAVFLFRVGLAFRFLQKIYPYRAERLRWIPERIRRTKPWKFLSEAKGGPTSAPTGAPSLPTRDCSARLGVPVGRCSDRNVYDPLCASPPSPLWPIEMFISIAPSDKNVDRPFCVGCMPGKAFPKSGVILSIAVVRRAKSLTNRERSKIIP